MHRLLHNVRSRLFAYDSMSRLMRGAVLALIVNVVGFSMGFLAQLVVGRALGLSGYGVYAYVQAWVSFVSMICGIGLPYALLRFVPEYKSQAALPFAQEVIRFAERRVLAISLATSLAGFGVMLVFGGQLDWEFAGTIYIGLVAMPLLAMLRVWCSALRAFGQIVSALGSDLPVREGLTFVVVAIFGLGFSTITTAPEALTVWTLGTAVGISISLFAWHRQKRPKDLQERPMITDDIRSHWLQVAFTLLVVQSLHMLLRRLDLFVVGFWFDKESLGIYAAANRLAEIMIFPTYVLTAYLAPMISELYSQGARADLQRVTTLTANMALGCAVIIVLPLVVIPELLLGLFGPDFSQGATTLRLLAVGEFVATITPFAAFMLTMTGHERSAVRWMTITSVTAFVALMLVGAAGGTIETIAVIRSACIIMTQLSLCLFIKKKIKILPYPLAAARTRSRFRMG